MKKITFPHMGYMNVPVKTFFESLGYEVLIPPKISRKTLDLGVKYGPEFACLPLKINLGNFIEAMEEGADVLIMGGGCGPCRFGYYAEVQQEILKDLGYEFEIFVIEPGILKNFNKIKNIFGNIPYSKIIPSAKLAWKKALVMDDIYKMVLENRAKEKETDIIDQIYNDFLEEIDNLMTIDAIEEINSKYSNKINQSIGEYKQGIEIRVGLVGEIYLVLEPYVNLDIEKKLGQLGVSVEKNLYITSWLKHFLHLSKEQEVIEKKAEKYLKNFVGGHGIDSIGNTVRYAEKGFDGVVQLAPFTCMPEIISESILPSVSKEENIPILSLFFDEHSGDAGLQTRLEAFVDLIVRRKQNKEGILYA
ncbi:acyl-CoA dehydratase activase-related protein [Natronospora cellulosivora (SeqCode)]